jgi:hypothetical protein
MSIDYQNEKGETLCFRHAVKAAIEKDEHITVSVAAQEGPYESGGYSFCRECSKES